MKRILLVLLSIVITAAALPLIGEEQTDEWKLARVRSNISWADGLMQSISSNPEMNASSEAYNKITEYLAYARKMLDAVQTGSADKTALEQKYREAAEKFAAIKKQYYKKQ